MEDIAFFISQWIAWLPNFFDWCGVVDDAIDFHAADKLRASVGHVFIHQGFEERFFATEGFFFAACHSACVGQVRSSGIHANGLRIERGTCNAKDVI